MNRLFLSAFAILLLISIGFGQVSYEASYAAQAGNPGGLNNEMDYDTAGWTTIMPGGFMANQWSSPISIPFSFNFYGQVFSSARVSANGVLTFTTSPSSLPGNNGMLPSSNLPDYSIAAFWEDFAQSPPILASDEVLIKTFGTAPNRQFWIKWSSYQWGPSSFVNVAVVLEEGSNKVYIVDQYSNPSAANNITATAGVQQDNQTAVSPGNNLPLAFVGFHYLDNHFYTFEPYDVPPEDLRPSALLSPIGQECGMGMESVSVSIKNMGQQSSTSYVASLYVNGILQLTENEFVSINPGDSIVHTFNQPIDFSQQGAHEINIVVSSPEDGNINNDSLFETVVHLKEIASFPFKEDFESPDHGWTSGGTNSSWAWSTPADSIIMGAASGLKAWVTNPQGNYNAFESSWVQSPCYNLANAPIDTWVSFQLWWETEDTWDGASLVASKDGGQSWVQVGSYSPQTWFNESFIPTLPGGVGQGWNGNISQGNGSGGWQKVFAQLPSSMIGESNVRFRIAFASNSANQYRGVAFDDFTIGTPPAFELGDNRAFCEGDTLFVNQTPGTLQWSNGSSQNFQVIEPIGTTPILDSMLALSITDAMGLERRDTFYFSVAPMIEASVAGIQHVDCYGASTGAINLSVQKGTAPYGFIWNASSGEQNLTGIPAGTYVVNIFDANGCETQINNVVVNQNDSLGLLSYIIDNQCFEDSLGSISLQGFGGQGPYTFSWTDGDSSELREELGAGVYQVELTDSLGCSMIETLAVYEPEPIEIEILDTLMASCDLSADGALDLSIRGGTAPYSIFGINDSMEVFAGNAFPVGNYEVFVEDSLGCGVGVATIEIESLEIPYQAGFILSQQDSMVSIEDTALGAESISYFMGDGNQLDSDSAFEYVYQANGDYTITQVIYNSCGTDTSYASVEIRGIDTTNTQTSIRRNDYTFVLYPNPSSGAITLKGPSFYKNITLNLYDLEGRVVLEKEVSSLPLRIRLPEDLKRGIYIIRLSGTGLNWREKLIYK